MMANGPLSTPLSTRPGSAFTGTNDQLGWVFPWDL